MEELLLARFLLKLNKISPFETINIEVCGIRQCHRDLFSGC